MTATGCPPRCRRPAQCCGVYIWCIHRTNLYLTHEQETALDARARAAGVSRSALVRAIIDQELARPAPVSPEAEETFRRMADRYDEAVRGLFDDDPDLRIE